MRRLAGLTLISALVAAFAFVSSAGAQESLSVTLDSFEGFSITGSATLTETADGYTEVSMEGAGLTDGETHANHIHDGTGCGDGEYGGVAASLTALEPSGGDTASATTTVTALDAGDAITFAEIADGNHVLVIHEADGTPAACGAIPAADGDGDTVSPPTTGTGGYLGADGGGAGLWLLAAGLLAAIGVTGVGSVLAARRVRG